MGTILLFVFLMSLLFASVSLQKTYRRIPVKELRRRARTGDRYAVILYGVVAHGIALDTLLWLLVVLSGAGVFTLINHQLAWWGAIPISAIIIWITFVWVPAGKISAIGNKLALIAAPLIAKLLLKLSPITLRFRSKLKKLSPITLHSGLYEKDDLLDLLNRQSTQIDNRIGDDELDLARSALTYSDRTVQEIMTPRGVVRKVNANETVGPVLMGHLHDSGFSRFPVYDGESDNIVGTLFLRDVVKTKDGRRVRDIMDATVYYVHAGAPLNQILDAFIKTSHHMFMVVDEFEEVLGIVTIEDVIEAILGQRIVDEFDKYDDMRAVAALRAEQLAKSRKVLLNDTHEKPTAEK